MKWKAVISSKDSIKPLKPWMTTLDRRNTRSASSWWPLELARRVSKKVKSRISWATHDAWMSRSTWLGSISWCLTIRIVRTVLRNLQNSNRTTKHKRKSKTWTRNSSSHWSKSSANPCNSSPRISQWKSMSNSARAKWTRARNSTGNSKYRPRCRFPSKCTRRPQRRNYPDWNRTRSLSISRPLKAQHRSLETSTIAFKKTPTCSQSINRISSKPSIMENSSFQFPTFSVNKWHMNRIESSKCLASSKRSISHGSHSWAVSTCSSRISRIHSRKKDLLLSPMQWNPWTSTRLSATCGARIALRNSVHSSRKSAKITNACTWCRSQHRKVFAISNSIP